MSDSPRVDLPPAPPCLVAHALSALHGQPPALQLAALLAAAAWLITQRFPGRRGPLLIAAAERLANHAALLDQQVGPPRR